jgi:DNA-directed RNA polymerase specialized sigma24 family protein
MPQPEPSRLPPGQLIVRSERRFPLRGSFPFASYQGVGSNTPVCVDASPNREREVERLYRTEGGKLWRAVMAYCGNPDVADDAVSEAFAQVLARGAEVHEPRSWLWRTTFRLTAGELKRSKIAIGRRRCCLRGAGAAGASDTVAQAA